MKMSDSEIHAGKHGRVVLQLKTQQLLVLFHKVCKKVIESSVNDSETCALWPLFRHSYVIAHLITEYFYGNG